MMTDFIISIFKGVYPFFFIFAVFGIVLRLKERKWTAFDSLLIGMFVIFELLTAFLPWIFYGELTTSRRYLLIGVPLYFPFAAMGFLAVWNCSRKRITWKHITTVLLGIMVCVTLYNIYSPVLKEFTSSKKSMERELTLVAADWIRQDWNARSSSRIPWLKCDEYQSGKRPLVDSELSLRRPADTCFHEKCRGRSRLCCICVSDSGERVAAGIYSDRSRAAIVHLQKSRSGK